MEIVYSVSKGKNDARDWFSDEKTALSISCRNVVAFSTSQELVKNNESDIKEKIDSNIKESQKLSYYLYVCDLDKPWDIHMVTSQDERIQSVEWDITGGRLLMVGGFGVCQIWAMKDHLINCWTLETTADMKGEDILTATWLHPGINYSFYADKKDAVYYNDKYVRSKLAPSISQFGGVAHDGWIVVTATGLVSVSVLKSDKTVTTCTKSLGPVRTRIMLADVSFMESGQIHVATSDGSISSSILCYYISLKMEHNSVMMTCQPSYSFFPRCHLDPTFKDSPNVKLMHLKFYSPEASDTMFICCVSNRDTVLELWKLQEQQFQVHRSFVNNANNLNMDNKQSLMKWVPKAKQGYSSVATAVGMPRFPVMQSIPDPTLSILQYVVIAFKDRSVHLLNKQNFHFMAHLTLDSGIANQEIDNKKRKIDTCPVAIQQSYSGCCMVAVDAQGVLYVLRPLNLRDQSQLLPPVYIVSLLEYAMVTGFDWWDIMLLVKSGTVENVLVRFHDNFYRQLHSVQEYLYTRFMGVRASLFRCNLGSQTKVADCLSKLLLNSVATAFKSIFRPKSLATQDKSPAEKLSITCSKYTETELDKILLNLETKEFIVEPGTLQSLQQLIQWVADFTLFLLSSVPMYATSSSFPGANIIHDTSALMTLRELLVIIRVWGLINQSCSPVFMTTTNIDIMALLFKLLTKVWLSTKDGNVEFDENLIDECCVLQSHLFIPNMEQIMLQDGRHFLLLQSQHVVRFEYGVTPDHLSKPVAYTMQFDGQSHSLQKRDCVHQLNLGNVPAEKVKECTRCGNVSLLKTTIKSVAMKAWDQRWSRMCMCGGQWKLAKYKNKA
ncbi:mediator of RNA polymerase II transcription subunit 16-like [Lineus longissimus]|uniref:mediator of RNA polymerase II transcription subunit 16-like n=1 Tax=Lineus longissimus TaxID=88925 RepID=UPI002B4DEF61